MKISITREEVTQILIGWARTQFVPAADPNNEVKVNYSYSRHDFEIDIDRKDETEVEAVPKTVHD